MMKRLILGITLSISLATSQGFAAEAAKLAPELKYLVESLGTKSLAEAQTSFRSAMASAKIAVNPGMLAAFAAIHTQIYSTKNTDLSQVREAIEKYNIESIGGVQEVLKGLKGNAFNVENVGKTSYVVGLQRGRQGEPIARVAAIGGKQRDEATLVVEGRAYQPSAYKSEFETALKGDSNESRANAVAVALVMRSLGTACEGDDDQTCAAVSKENAEAYLALHVFPLAGKYSAQALSLLAIGINVDGLQSSKTGIKRVALRGGLKQILKNPKQLSDENSHLGACGLGKAQELSSYKSFATAL